MFGKSNHVIIRIGTDDNIHVEQDEVRGCRVTNSDVPNDVDGEIVVEKGARLGDVGEKGHSTCTEFYMVRRKNVLFKNRSFLLFHMKDKHDWSRK